MTFNQCDVFNTDKQSAQETQKSYHEEDMMLFFTVKSTKHHLFIKRFTSQHLVISSFLFLCYSSHIRTLQESPVRCFTKANYITSCLYANFRLQSTETNPYPAAQQSTSACPVSRDANTKTEGSFISSLSVFPRKASIPPLTKQNQRWTFERDCVWLTKTHCLLHYYNTGAQ